MRTEVIVAGGGPVGLTVAALLDAAGVSVTVFERDTTRGTYSRATTLHPRTLETLDALRFDDRRRVSDVLVEQGRRVPHAHFATLPVLLDYTRLPTRYPFVLMLSQLRTEAVLAGYLVERGVPVHRGREVTGFEQDAEGVRVRAGDGTWAAGYLIGADGAHSVVRKLSGIEFDGVPPTVVGFGADVRLAEQPATAAYHWRRDVGSAAIVPLSDTEVRIFGVRAGDTGLTAEQARARQAEPLTLPELREILVRVVGEDGGLRSATWLSRTSNTTRHAARYRAGRVLLAGDAAHVHLPAGGQGLNVGIQDAANLAWKLAAEIQGWAPAAVRHGPAGYDEERRVIGERLAGNTLAQDALMHNFTAAGESLRALFGRLLGQESVADELRGWLSGLDLAYPQPAGAAPLVGRRAPDLTLPDGPLLRRLRPDRLLLLDFTAEGTFAALATTRCEVLPADPAGTAWAGSTAALVRPDGYVAHTSAATTADELAGELSTWF